MSRGNLTESFIERVNISLLQMLIRGYEPAPTSSLPARLRSIRPNGSTAMRDAVVQGTSLMLDLFKVLNDQGMARSWNFVHVILTDGADNSSKVNMQQTKAVLKLIHDQLGGLNLRIIFIGVGVDSSTSYVLK
jgi:hypothetical protein